MMFLLLVMCGRAWGASDQFPFVPVEPSAPPLEDEFYDNISNCAVFDAVLLVENNQWIVNATGGKFEKNGVTPLLLAWHMCTLPENYGKFSDYFSIVIHLIEHGANINTKVPSSSLIKNPGQTILQLVLAEFDNEEKLQPRMYDRVKLLVYTILDQGSAASNVKTMYRLYKNEFKDHKRMLLSILAAYRRDQVKSGASKAWGYVKRGASAVKRGAGSAWGRLRNLGMASSEPVE